MEIDEENQQNEAKRNGNHPSNMHLFWIVLTGFSMPMTHHTHSRTGCNNIWCRCFCLCLYGCEYYLGECVRLFFSRNPDILLCDCLYVSHVFLFSHKCIWDYISFCIHFRVSYRVYERARGREKEEDDDDDMV